MIPAPWTPPDLALSLEEARLWTALASHAGQALPLEGGRTAVFRLISAPAPTKPAYLVETDASWRAVVSVTAFPFDTLFGSDLAATEVFDLPAPLRDAVLEGVTGLVWSALPDELFGAPAIAAAGPIADMAERLNEPRAWFNIALEGLAAEPIKLLVGCERDALLPLLKAEIIAPSPGWSGLKDRLTEEVAHTIGRLTLPLRELASLRVADAVVLSALDPATALLRVAGRMVTLRSGGETWTVQDVSIENRFRQHGGSFPMSDPPSAERDTSMASLRNLPIVLDFDIGRTTVSLAEIETWQVGAIVTLDIPRLIAGVEVTVRANGRTVAMGDLVRIDDRFAVRLTRLWLAESP